MKFKESFVITISREVGTGGRTIGRKLAERMDINFYDKELIHVLMKRFNLNAETIEQIKGEKKSWLSDFIRFVSPMPAASAILESDAKFGKESYSEVTSDDIYKADEIESEFGHYDQINVYRSDCYSELGLNEMAITDISKVMEKDASWDNLCRRGDYYRLSGDIDAAIADFSAAIEDTPDEGYAYYKRGWCYEMKGDKKRALEDYNMGLEMTEDYPYLYLMRGELLLQEGNKAEADEDFETVIQKDTIADGTSCRQYALHFLGRDKEAEEWMDKIIDSDPEDDGNYYDKACLYSRMGRGIGTDNIDIVMTELDALVNVDFSTREIKPDHTSLTIVRVGTCGAIQPEIPLGSFILSHYSIGFDGLLNWYAKREEITNIDMEVLWNAAVGHQRQPFSRQGRSVSGSQ